AIKIMHINSHYEVIYVIINDGALIKSTVPLETAISMLKNDTFDLILAEPQNMAILTPQTPRDDFALSQSV
ncbi:MAG: hypothetical protein ABSE95_16895, partial [Thermodesulfobacteriota bacterium]